MRKLMFCVPMMILLLSACAGGGGQEEQLSLAVRGSYLEMTACTASVTLTADYGQRVYRYELELTQEGENTTLTLTAPDIVAGITARLEGKDGLLEYDSLSVETGRLDGDGLTPVSAIPTLLETARSGYITACALEEEGALLRLDCGDPEGRPGEGLETTLWFDAQTHALVRGEIRTDGFRAILCEFSNFTMG